MPSETNIGFNDYTKVGGISLILYSAMPFWGATRNQVNIKQAATASLGFQWKVYNYFYFKRKFNYLNTRYPMIWLNNLNDEHIVIDRKLYEGMFGIGAEVAYSSPVDPIRFLLHQNQYSNNLNVFVALGYNIFKSDGDF